MNHQPGRLVDDHQFIIFKHNVQGNSFRLECRYRRRGEVQRQDLTGLHGPAGFADMLVEDVHFLRRAFAPADLGWKSLAVNLSDIAAMGGSPHAAFLSLALPRDVEVAWVDAFFAGLKELADSTGTELLGGDTTSSPERVVVNIAVLGRARPERVKLRSGARPGDVVA